MKKPVVETDSSECWDFKFQAKYYTEDTVIFLASNSLINLKREVKRRKWDEAWLTCTEGNFSYGQNIVDEYPYTPRYSKTVQLAKAGR